MMVKTELSDQAVILVGGKGTRLSELAKSTPKPLLKTGQYPFLEHLLLRCRHYNLKNIILLSGHLHEQISDYTAGFSQRHPDMAVRNIAEPTPLGTAGGLKQAASLLEDSFLMMNGDSIFDFPWPRLRERLSPDATGIIALRAIGDAGRYGSVRLEGQKIRAFAEKTRNIPNALINGGVYCFRRSIIDYIGNGPESLEHDIFPQLAGAGKLDGLVETGHFIDIGIPQDLRRADTLVPAWTRRLLSPE